jgi:hypothetical protein
MTPSRQPPSPSPLGAEIPLRHLSPAEALLLADSLNRLAVAVWDAFGDDSVRPDWDSPWPVCHSCPAATYNSRR